MSTTALSTSASASVPTIAHWGRVRTGRRIADASLKIVCVLFTLIGVAALGWILGMLVVRGVSALRASI